MLSRQGTVLLRPAELDADTELPTPAPATPEISAISANRRMIAVQPERPAGSSRNVSAAEADGVQILVADLVRAADQLVDVVVFRMEIAAGERVRAA
jgi:hypothetical protein